MRSLWQTRRMAHEWKAPSPPLFVGEIQVGLGEPTSTPPEAVDDGGHDDGGEQPRDRNLVQDPVNDHDE